MSSERPKLLVFSDFTETLLDDTPHCENAKAVISELQSMDVSIIFCSSKTRAEIEYHMEELGVCDSFIAESGGEIVIPKNYFPFSYRFSKHTKNADIIELAIPYTVVREKLAKIKLETGAGIVGFGDLSTEEIATETGMPLNLAKLSKHRVYNEPCRLLWGNMNDVVDAAEKEGLSIVNGEKYFHLIGGSNKGKAINVLKDMYAQAFEGIITFGVGDFPMDTFMLKVVDMPLMVRKVAGGRNAHLVAWQNLFRLITQKIGREISFNVLGEQQSTLSCQNHTSPITAPKC